MGPSSSPHPVLCIARVEERGIRLVSSIRSLSGLFHVAEHHQHYAELD